MAARIFVGLLASSLYLLMPQAAQGKSAKQAASQPPAISRQTVGQIELPFEYFKKHIFVTLSLNGKPGFTFMLDSGANRNILNLRTARQLGMMPGAVKQERNIGFGDSPIYIAPQEDLNAEIDSVQVADKMAVMDLTKLEHHFGHPADGMLGYPFFQRFVVKVDFEKRLLLISPADRFRYRGRGFQVSLKPSRNFIVVPVRVGDTLHTRHEIDVAIDTGSDVTMMLYQPFVAALDLDSSFEDAVPAMAFGLNGYYPVALGNIGSFQIGKLGAHNVPVDYLSNTEQVGPERDLPGAIGMGVLLGFREVIFDVPHRRIVFELKPSPLTPETVSTVTY